MFLTTEKRRRNKEKKLFSILTDVVSVYFCFCFETWPQQTLSALSLNCIMYALCVSARLHFGFSFYLRCFPVILSCVCRLEIMSSLCPLPLPFTSVFVFDRDNAVHSGRKAERKLETVDIFPLASPTGSDELLLLLSQWQLAQGLVFNDNDNDSEASVL